MAYPKMNNMYLPDGFPNTPDFKSLDENSKIDKLREDAVLWNEASGDVQKNLLNNTASTQTINGVTFTVNDDGSVTVNGTATEGGATFNLNEHFRVKSGIEYIISDAQNGGLIGGSNSTFRIWVNSASAFPSGNRFSTDSVDDMRRTARADANALVYIQVFEGVSMDNVRFYPMIRLAGTATEYVPYVPSNSELAAQIAGLSTGWNYSTDEFDTGMKWTDGSPVYGKVLQTSTLVAGTNDINHGITGLNHLLNYYGYIATVSSGDVPLPVVAAAAANMTGIQAVDATKVVLYIGSNYAGTYAPASANVVIFYTKTVSP